MSGFAGPRAPNAPQISRDVWEPHRPVIEEAYKTMTLKQLVGFMQREHDFYATGRQYIHAFSRWDIRKYNKGGLESPPSESPARNAAASAEHDASEEPPPASPDTVPSPVNREPPAPPAPPPQPWTPDLDSADKILGHYRLAEMLLALGDAEFSFIINAQLFKTVHTFFMAPETSRPSILGGAFSMGDMLPLVDGRLANLVACARTALTREQADTARAMLNDGIDLVLGGDDEGGANDRDVTWARFVLRLLLAATYDGDAGARFHSVELIEEALLGVTLDHQGPPRLRELIGRGPRLDITAYSLLSWALSRFNHDADADADADDGEDCIDSAAILDQFLHQQPALPSGLGNAQLDPRFQIDCLGEIDCVPRCLRWCMSTLANGPAIPAAIRRAVRNRRTAVYAVLCTLWDAWWRSTLASPLSSLAWTVNAEPQLGISATELLATVVYMIMADAPRRETWPDGRVLLRALVAAEALNRLTPTRLLRRFLIQVRYTGEPQMTGRNARHGCVPLDGGGFVPPDGAAEMVQPFRNFVANTLRIDGLPILGPDAAVTPLTLANPGLLAPLPAGHDFGQGRSAGTGTRSSAAWADARVANPFHL
ncbi:hypothetical protein BT67DRAFT_436988 [Trichocladium antarcticum]|uniref:Clr5 domain-containing protein n=1 Tax=Trichocladium antarcticum TaxID=1450529 RepID=A0AAN6Z9A5_9PEZI|nr:hypothetical protein BT67DRAFT_436988 [Trichocladium antarcticum]